jgi:acyl transferase domain-containing protein
VLDDVESFDPAFFGLSPRVAEVMDPQQRVLLETAWQAFEDAGIVPGDEERLTGVFTGVSHDEYAERNLATRPDLARQLGELAIVFGNDKDYSASHIAHRLDLRGPAVAVQTSSSTSLTAVALAVQALRAGQCDLALAGGASVSVPVQRGHRHEEGAMFSRDGHTRAFDADASGTVFSDGVAMLLLQRLEDARRDGHRILGVIAGVGMTNDGAMRASFSAPTVQGQVACITRALADAGWSADSIQYVEAHGTGTPLGDPIEVTALTRAFAAHTPRTRFCWLGSLKSNIGHLTAAAGAAGVIKVLLAMHHRRIPATLHVDRPNPRIDFANSPFLLARAGVPWEAEGGVRRAGVSSFGVGGTNVHVLLEAWEDVCEDASRATTRGDAHAATRRPTLLRLSARTGTALCARAAQLADAIDTAEAGGPNDALSLGAVASTLRHGRRTFAHRATIVAGTLDQAVERLRAFAASAEPAADAPVSQPPAVVLLFPGQGTQTPGAARTLYEALPVFRDAIDRCAEAAGLLQGHALTTWLFASESTVPDVADRLRATDLAQPVLFALEYALGHTLMAAGITPVAMVGHSIGEFAAACLSGVMGVEDAMRAVVARGQLMGARPAGAMLAVRLSADALVAELAKGALPGITLAAVNAPQLCVVAGSHDAIEQCERAFAAAEISCRRLQTSHAFHSPAMDEAARAFERVMRGVALHPPTIPFVSCVTGALITPELATDPAYWARQLREPVRFADGLAAAVARAGDRTCVGVEAGPRETLTTLARQSQRDRVRPVALLPLAEGVDERDAFLAAVGALWERGVEGVTWDVIDPLPRERPVSLPGYPFDRRRCWIDPLPSKVTRVADSGVDSLLEVQMQLLQDQLGILTRAMAASPVGADVEQS